MAFPEAEEVTDLHERQSEAVTAEDLLPEAPEPEPVTFADAQLKAVLEAIIYVTDEPLSLEQICIAIEQPRDRVIDLLEQLTRDYELPERGLTIREVAGGFKMATKPEHHEAVRRFVKNLNPPLKLSLPALETLAVIAYKQPITAPEIMEIRGVQGAGVLKTLLDRKLIGTAGRKQVVGKPILYKTTREFLVQFGLKDLAELPTLKEFQEIGRMDTEAQAERRETETSSAPLLFPTREPIEEPTEPTEPTPFPEQDPAPDQPPVEEPPAEPAQIGRGE
ncbi:MAG: SMC-Scp complex subunit ScpB [Terriglobia bacterium]